MNDPILKVSIKIIINVLLSKGSNLRIIGIMVSLEELPPHRFFWEMHSIKCATQKSSKFNL